MGNNQSEGRRGSQSARGPTSRSKDEAGRFSVFNCMALSPNCCRKEEHEVEIDNANYKENPDKIKRRDYLGPMSPGINDRTEGTENLIDADNVTNGSNPSQRLRMERFSQAVLSRGSAQRHSVSQFGSRK